MKRHDVLGSKLNTYYLIRHVNNILTQNYLLPVYCAQKASHLHYEICFWGSCSTAAQVFLHQKRFLRCLANVGMLRSKPLFKKFLIPTLPNILVFELSISSCINKSNLVSLISRVSLIY